MEWLCWSRHHRHHFRGTWPATSCFFWREVHSDSPFLLWMSTSIGGRCLSECHSTVTSGFAEQASVGIHPRLRRRCLCWLPRFLRQRKTLPVLQGRLVEHWKRTLYSFTNFNVWRNRGVNKNMEHETENTLKNNLKTWLKTFNISYSTLSPSLCPFYSKINQEYGWLVPNSVR